MDEHEDQPRVKRFKHQSYNQTLKDVHLPAAYNQAQLDHEISDNDSHFHQALDHWRQLNLAPSFISFANKADSLSASMPLLLHNWREIIDLWTGALEVSDDEGLRALLDLLQKMAHDLRTTLSPAYPSLLKRLLALLPRSISAPALTALLETFSALFKFLLVPLTQTDLLEHTWGALRSTLPSCLPEIQRAMAEVWGSVLRRMKAGAREKTVALLAEGAEGIEDASAWVIVFACKSVSQTLHTATPSIIAPLLSYHLSTPTPEPTYTLLRRVLTALIHHVKNAAQFAPLADLLVRHFSSTVKSLDSTSPTSQTENKIESVRRILEVLAVPTAVRQGSRVTQAQLSLLFADLPSIPLVPSLHPALVKFATAALVAAEMPLWLGPGVKFLQRAWGAASTTTDEDGDEDDLGWGGWKLVALPLLLKMTVSSGQGQGQGQGQRGVMPMERDPRAILHFLAELKRAKKLNAGETDLVWRDKIEKVALGRLSAWGKERERGAGVDAAVELTDILTLSPLFSPAVSSLILDLITGILTSDTKNEHDAWVLEVCMDALTKRAPAEWRDHVDVKGWIRGCVGRWGGSAGVLAGLVVVAQIVFVSLFLSPVSSLQHLTIPSFFVQSTTRPFHFNPTGRNIPTPAVLPLLALPPPPPRGPASPRLGRGAGPAGGGGGG
ncbi:hypothetical protein FPV67DRAFT_1428362 [Lyophyllum atratum]|nr:hypothetical protein FPV67DRAFT_1428362 [Lyophyllum atratum]